MSGNILADVLTSQEIPLAAFLGVTACARLASTCKAIQAAVAKSVLWSSEIKRRWPAVQVGAQASAMQLYGRLNFSEQALQIGPVTRADYKECPDQIRTHASNPASKYHGSSVVQLKGGVGAVALVEWRSTDKKAQPPHIINLQRFWGSFPEGDFEIARLPHKIELVELVDRHLLVAIASQKIVHWRCDGQKWTAPVTAPFGPVFKGHDNVFSVTSNRPATNVWAVRLTRTHFYYHMLGSESKLHEIRLPEAIQAHPSLSCISNERGICAVYASNQTIHWLNCSDGVTTTLRTFKQGSHSIHAVSIFRRGDDTYIAALELMEKLRVWNFESGEEKWAVDLQCTAALTYRPPLDALQIGTIGGLALFSFEGGLALPPDRTHHAYSLDLCGRPLFHLSNRVTTRSRALVYPAANRTWNFSAIERCSAAENPVFGVHFFYDEHCIKMVLKRAQGYVILTPNFDGMLAARIN